MNGEPNNNNNSVYNQLNGDQGQRRQSSGIIVVGCVCGRAACQSFRAIINALLTHIQRDLNCVQHLLHLYEMTEFISI